MSIKITHKTRYIVFIVTVIITIVLNEIIIQSNIKNQLSDAEIINMAGRQRMLSQQIAKQVLSIGNDSDVEKKKELQSSINEWENAHNQLISGKLDIKHTDKIDSLYGDINPYFKRMLIASRELIENDTTLKVNHYKKEVMAVEEKFLTIMDAIVYEYQNLAEAKLHKTKKVVFTISVLSVLLILAEFIFILIPLFKKLQKQNNLLTQKNRRLSDFAHITSHNLRAPISNINSLLGIYRMENNVEDKDEVINKLFIVTSKLNNTMEFLLDALKTEHDSTKEKEDVSLSDTLTETIEILKPQIAETKAEIVADFSEMNRINYNKIYMDSIFLNLMTNHLKYRHPDRSPKIHVSGKLVKRKPTLIFSDNGLGIDMDKHRDKLFGLGKTFHRHPEARGVGLFMTRTQIESLGGHIEVDSTVNKGTTFTITL